MNEVLNLLPRKKKGILRVIFSRTGIIALLIVLEIAILAAVFSAFNEYWEIFVLLQAVFTFIMVFYLINCQMDSTAKVTWLFLMSISPVPTSIFLFLSKRDFVYRTLRWRINDINKKTKDMLTPESVNGDKEIAEAGLDNLSKYVNVSGPFPIFKNTSTQFFKSGESFFESLIADLKTAEKFIFLEYFIIEEGYMWGSILKILADKVSQGVDVRVMYDGMCEVKLLPHKYPKLLNKLGIKCKPFLTITPFISTYYNYRDHRKIAVIDGKIAYNGGVNLADEYINRVCRFGHWSDTAIKLTGEAVSSFTLMFLSMWNMDETKPSFEGFLDSPKVESDGYCMPFSDSPMDKLKVSENIILDMLYKANNYVHIMTPYLILDDELKEALKFTAQRGVDVKLILPGIPDKKAAYALAKSHYKELIRAGVKIYEYTPGFVHAKVFVCDDIKGIVGTVNLDYRSLYHHFECATYLYKTSCLSDMEQNFNEHLKSCKQVTEQTIKKEKLYYKIMSKVMKVFAPLM